MLPRPTTRARYLYAATSLPPATRNQGIVEARGAFIAFLDADDLWHREKLARQMARFEARPDLGYCLTLVQVFWEDHLREEAERLRDHRRTNSVPGYATVTLLARRELFDTVGLLDPTLATSDAADWFLRAARHGVAMEVVPQVLVYRRIHGANLTRRNLPARRREWLRFVKAYLDSQRELAPDSLPGFSLPQLDSDA
jgi:glycosyltransferase involved in cell wall biosynthesis